MSFVQDLLQHLAFRNNANLRPAGAVVEYTQEMVDEWLKCKTDPIYFMQTYVHVVHLDRGVVKMKPYSYQEKMIEAYHLNRRVVALTPRQYGKCLSINSTIRVRSKTTGEIKEMTLGEFYELQNRSRVQMLSQNKDDAL